MLLSKPFNFTFILTVSIECSITVDMLESLPRTLLKEQPTDTVQEETDNEHQFLLIHSTLRS